VTFVWPAPRKNKECYFFARILGCYPDFAPKLVKRN
ncbi:MAG: hypothetical protein ACI90V_003548, partial [Bacillariaceae sp.]